MQLCGKCGQTRCTCANTSAARTIDPRASGAALDALGARYDVRRQPGETDATYRPRVQLTVATGAPWRGGIPSGALLDKMCRRHGLLRSFEESDEDLRIRLMLCRATLPDLERAREIVRAETRRAYESASSPAPKSELDWNSWTTDDETTEEWARRRLQPSILDVGGEK